MGRSLKIVELSIVCYTKICVTSTVTECDKCPRRIPNKSKHWFGGLDFGQPELASEMMMSRYVTIAMRIANL